MRLIGLLTYVVVVSIGICASSLIIFNFALQTFPRFFRRQNSNDDEDGDGRRDADGAPPGL